MGCSASFNACRSVSAIGVFASCWLMFGYWFGNISAAKFQQPMRWDVTTWNASCDSFFCRRFWGRFDPTAGEEVGVEQHGMAWTLLDSGWQDRSFRRPTVFSAGQWSPARDSGQGGDHLRWLLASSVTSAVSSAIALAIESLDCWGDPNAKLAAVLISGSQFLASDMPRLNGKKLQ